MLKEAIKKVVDREDLTLGEAEHALNIIMSGQATPSQIACLITALRMKGETVEEITGFAKMMREHAIKIRPNSKNLVDTCGTGGDLSYTFNISTAAAFAAAGAGVKVAKHGNRSVSSHCGSADLLEALGVKIDIEPKKVEAAIDQIGIGFLYAPSFHQAMKFVMPSRKEIGIRTIFNVLGPLTNPSGAARHVLGVFDSKLVEPIAGVLKNLGVEHALVVHSGDGLDEISISAPTKVAELKNEEIKNYEIAPEEFGFKRGALDALICRDLETSKGMTLEVLKGIIDDDPFNVTVFNAGAVIYVSGMAANIKEGIGMAVESVKSGAAMKKLQELIKFCGN